MSRLVDLSHTIGHGTVTYPGLPAPALSDHLTREEAESHYAPGVRFHIGRIDMIANTGTYLDSPWHRWEDGADLAGLPLDAVADLPGVLVDVASQLVEGDRSIEPSSFDGTEVAGKAVLVRTGFDRHWGTEAYGSDSPFLTRAAAEDLVERGARLVGIDSLNIDDPDDGERPAHSVLLGNEVLIVEHMTNLFSVDAPFTFSAIPVKVEGMGTFPVRAFARLAS